MKIFFVINFFLICGGTAIFLFAFWQFSKFPEYVCLGPDFVIGPCPMDWYTKHNTFISVCILAGLLVFFLLTFCYYLRVTYSDPGYSKGFTKRQFYHFLDKAIKEGRNLDYFCFFCRSLWSSTGVHCMTCGKCVEGFDHHCTFVDNCIGYKNHAVFLNFLFCGFFYQIIMITGDIWAVFRFTKEC